MKKWIAMVLLMMTLTWLCASAFAKVDLSYVRKNDMYSIDVFDEGYALIRIKPDLKLKEAQELKHKYSIEDHPSRAYTDVVITDYFDEDAFPYVRLWFEYNAPELLGITSATITMNGTPYTFTDIGNKDGVKKHEGYYTEKPFIVLGKNTMEFWLNFLFLNLEKGSDIVNVSFPVVLHGIEDVETELSGASLAEWYLLGILPNKMMDPKEHGSRINDGTEVISK